MMWLLIFGIIFIGLLFILADILFIPGGFVGIIGGLILVYGVYLSFSKGTMAGIITMIITIVLIGVSFYLALKSKTWNKVKLDTEISSKADINLDAVLEVGDTGKSLSRLMPMGKARFGNNIVEVSSLDGPISEGSEIEITKIDNSKIYVKLKN